MAAEACRQTCSLTLTGLRPAASEIHIVNSEPGAMAPGSFYYPCRAITVRGTLLDCPSNPDIFCKYTFYSPHGL